MNDLDIPSFEDEDAAFEELKQSGAVSSPPIRDLLFYTCANEAYEDYIPLYIASCLWQTSDSAVEIGMVSAGDYVARNAEVIDVLGRRYFGRFMLRNVPWDGVIPNTVRFINQPTTLAKYVYIGDIDILHLDSSFPSQHLAYMTVHGVNYANSFRKGTNRLTGLHFTKWEAMYPLPDLSKIDLAHTNDEIVLGMIADAKGQDRPVKWFRPVPGIHISPNREPLTPPRPDGGMGLDWGAQLWIKEYRAFRQSPVFIDLLPHLKGKAADAIEKIDAAMIEIQSNPIYAKYN